jgi:pilus assembly protein CpaC
MNAARTAPRRLQLARRPTTFYSLLLSYIIIVLVAAPQAQQPPEAYPAAATSPAIRGAADGNEIDLLVGRSTILNIGSTITRVSLTVPDVADAMVTAPSQLLVHGKAPGTISMFVWDKAGAIKTYEVRVRRDLSALVAQLKQLFPGESISVLGSGTDVVLSGTVSGQYVIEKAADVAGGYVEKKENVVNLLKQQEGVASNQVMLRVRFAEVSRSAITELGASFFTGPGGFHDYVARTSTQQFTAPNLDEMVRSSIQGPDKWGGGRDTVDATGGKYTLSDFLNLFVFNNKYNVGAVVKALSEKGLFQSLAEPNLIATNGKEASFLAGGEFPYPVVQGGGANASVTIQFKEFGVRLNFTPTVLGGDLIHLKVRPEVSALDFANGVTVEGFRVPALSTRRTETEVELRDGQTFAIAGLMNNTTTDAMRKIPGIGDIPILGWLFKSRAMQKNQTELVVMITPTIVRRGQSGVSEGLPSLVEPYLGRPDRTVPNPDAYTGSPRYPATEPARPGGGEAPETPAPAPAPATVSGVPMVARPVAPQNVHPAASGDAAPAANGPTRPNGSVSTPPAAAPAVEAVPDRQPVAPTAPAASAAAPVIATPAPAAAPAPTREEMRARAEAEKLEKKRREEEEKAAREAARKAEEDRKVAERKAEADRKAAEKAAREQAKRDAETAKRNEEIARKKAEEDAKRDKALTDAAARLKAAQDAYQAEVERTNGKKPSSGGY